jgi:hypothetical protein
MQYQPVGQAEDVNSHDFDWLVKSEFQCSSAESCANFNSSQYI